MSMNKFLIRRIIPVLITIAILAFSCQKIPDSSLSKSIALDSILTPISAINTAVANHNSDIIVTVKGTITAILSDDTIAKKHQRFIIKLSNDQTLLITHNIDIAPRVAGIATGSLVYVHGVYVWNSKGGVVHWTHHDPDGVHETGWIVFGGKKYQ